MPFTFREILYVEYGPLEAKVRAFVLPPADSACLQLINYGNPSSNDYQELVLKYGPTAPPRSDLRTGHWDAVVDSAILTDLSHVMYREGKWTNTPLFTHAHGKYAEDMRQTASYLDHNEQTIVNTLASRLVYAAFEGANLKLLTLQ